MRSKEELFAEIEALKEINLIDFVCNVYQFQIDLERTDQENHNKDFPKYVFLTNDAGDKILISRIQENGRQIYLYKNLYNDLDKGNILSFIKYRNMENYSIPMAKKTIKDFAGNIEKGFFKPTGYSISLSKQQEGLHSESKVEAVRQAYMKLPEFKHPEYLVSRGISQELLLSPLLQKRIKNEYVYGLKISSTRKPGIKYINTVFPIYTIENGKTMICGYVRKNKELKITADHSAQSIGIWLSNYKRDQGVTHMVICENPIDAISYTQLNIDMSASNPLLVASNGELTKTQTEIYQQIVSRLRPETIVLANDNNCKGQLFNAKILATLGLPDKFHDSVYYDKNKLIVDAQISCGYRNKQTGEINWTFEHNKIEDNLSREGYVLEHIPQFQRVVEYYENVNYEKFLESDEKYPFTIEKKFERFHSRITISFDNSKINWVDINKSLLQLKYDYSEHIKLEVPKNTDFNDDLKEISGLLKGQQEEVLKHSL